MPSLLRLLVESIPKSLLPLCPRTALPSKITMHQASISSPKISYGPGYSTTYACYLHATAWVLRKAVGYMTGTGELFDKFATVTTPGIGEGRVNISVCIPRLAGTTQGSRPLILVAEGGGFVLGQPSDGEHIDRSLCDKVCLIADSAAVEISVSRPNQC